MRRGIVVRSGFSLHRGRGILATKDWAPHVPKVTYQGSRALSIVDSSNGKVVTSGLLLPYGYFVEGRIGHLLVRLALDAGERRKVNGHLTTPARLRTRLHARGRCPQICPVLWGSFLSMLLPAGTQCTGLSDPFSQRGGRGFEALLVQQFFCSLSVTGRNIQITFLKHLRNLICSTLRVCLQPLC
jgi:hypothetical protein